MSETTPSPQAGGQQKQPPLVVNIQYVKDLSFSRCLALRRFFRSSRRSRR